MTYKTSKKVRDAGKKRTQTWRESFIAKGGKLVTIPFNKGMLERLSRLEEIYHMKTRSGIMEFALVSLEKLTKESLEKSSTAPKQEIGILLGSQSGEGTLRTPTEAGVKKQG